MYTRIKVCGVASLRDAGICVELGVDFVGLIFADSPRQVGIEVAAKIADELKGKTSLVGVLAHQDLKQIDRITGEVDLDYLQIYYGPGEQVTATLPLPLIASVWIEEGGEIPYSMAGDYILLDFKRLGGLNGEVATEVRELLNEQNVFLAGGIDADNVTRVIERYRPFGIDCARGTESAPGIKDHAKLRLLVERVRSCTG